MWVKKVQEGEGDAGKEAEIAGDMYFKLKKQDPQDDNQRNMRPSLLWVVIMIILL